jgi:hypothetical protein
MIYLIITASINNKFGTSVYEQRKQRYIDAITDTLKYLPDSITPLIVENNGLRETFLDNFTHNGQQVRVIYTNNNQLTFKSKGVNEFLDVKEIIDRVGIQFDDIVIKLTGRYRVLSPKFFEDIIENQTKYDAFVKFFGTCSLKYENYDCILGIYAIRTMFLKLFNPKTIENYDSAEIGFARYIRFCGAKIKEIEELNLECCFAEDERILIV